MCAFGRFSLERVPLFSYFSAIFLSGGATYLYFRKRDRIRHISRQNSQTMLFVLISVAYTALMLYVFSIVPSNPAIRSRNDFVIFVFLAVLAIAYSVYCSVGKKWGTRRMIFAIFFIGYVMHLFYILYTDLNIRQNDTGVFSEYDIGHLGYAERIYRTGLPPQSDPTVGTYEIVSQFYHPPLYHYLLAAFVRVQILCGTSMDMAVYNFQFVNLLVYMVMLVAVYRLFKEFGLKKSALCCSFAVVTFAPAFFI